MICTYLGQELANYHFGESHPFGPKRHDAFKDEFLRRELDKVVEVCEPVQCDESLLELFHTSDYVQLVKEKSATGSGYLDYGDTPAMPGIFETCLYVVGSVIDLADRIMKGETRCGFVPIAGLHHARRDRAAGFCVFNDCAVLIEYLRDTYNLQRIAYVDIDAHHGDGVYYGFESDPNVIIVDLHEDADYLYPGTGRNSEVGTGEAEGTKLNFNLAPESGDDRFNDVWPQALSLLREHQPDFVILQCGVDSIAGDPITHMAFSHNAHYTAAKDLVAFANEMCEGRIIASGGGGYNLDNIAYGWNAVVQAMVDACE